LNLGAGIVAAPMTYALDGEQYIAVAVGWGGGLVQVAGALASHANHSGINRLVVLKLNGAAVLPAVVPSVPRLTPPPPSGTPQSVAAGRLVYERRCYVCHGGGAISGGEVPDLRYSAALRDQDLFRHIVVRGSLAVAGMPGFGRDLNDADADAVRDYVIERANASPAAGATAH
jgi:alcohol dehydrogenase (cytochrome c)/quinohemoprotein ethanol dehydrogenase